MRNIVIPFLCLVHMFTLFWWALPHSFGSMFLMENEQKNIETHVFKLITVDEASGLAAFLKSYIDATGSQQYWDFFAPQSPRFHQYLSICNGGIIVPDQENIICAGSLLFSNLGDDYKTFSAFGSNRSRMYRLTENLIKLNEPLLLSAFTSYYRKHANITVADNSKTRLIMHQFELNPNLKELPKYGYRSDKVLWVCD
jgi:hypothetical protein